MQAQVPAKVIYSLCNQAKLFRISETASNEFQCKNIVICQQQTPPLHTLHVSSIFIYLSMKDLVKHQRRSFLQQQNAANQGLFYPLIDKSTMPFLRNEILCYVLKSPKTHSILESVVLSTVNLEKLRMKLHSYPLLTNFLKLALLSLLIKINISNDLKFISIIHFHYSDLLIDSYFS